MCRIASLFLLQRLKGSMSGEARDFNNIETRAVINFFFLQGKATKEIHAIRNLIKFNKYILCVILQPLLPNSHPHFLVVHPVPTNEAMTTESLRYNCFIRNGGNAIPKHASSEAKGSSPTAGLNP